MLLYIFYEFLLFYCFVFIYSAFSFVFVLSLFCVDCVVLLLFVGVASVFCFLVDGVVCCLFVVPEFVSLLFVSLLFVVPLFVFVVSAFVVLFVSVLGQINIGLSSLEQRTHELLIRRAIGASRANIVTLVLGTQLIISIFVCIASILLSLLIVEGISVLLPPDSPITAPSYPIFSAVIAVITSVIVALLGGLLPAIKAAKLEPALALR
jgi:ABC-type antimicrobial peptide transport system permease subunit